MKKQQLEQQIDFVRRELTRLNQEISLHEGVQAQMLRVRQNRLIAELERLEALLHNQPSAVPAMATSH
ncbi:MAG: hypothetical protein RMN25_02145 [Anaerolineae bacterium]|nr:hypothetical protein [Thermoflexales bacterium]MDW8406557.1 hypothetical protein [Anaerolineae bacterium]